jgi:lipoprotein signal peptidase
MARCALALGGTAALLAGVDLVHKASSDAAYVHSRSSGYVVLVVVLAALWTSAIVLTRSLSIAVGGGVLAAGAAGNLMSLAFSPGVPNPLALGPIAFNLADVFVLAGFVLVAGATLVFALRNRERMSEPVRLRI